MSRFGPADEPDIRIGVFSLWIKGGPDKEDWLEVSAACDAPFASIRTSGSILQFKDLRCWLTHLQQMNERLQGTARLYSAEPNIDLSFTMDQLGNIDGTLKITPDSASQFHEVRFEIDQSYLPGLITSLKEVIGRCENEP